SENGAYNERTGGYKYLEFIRNIDDTFANEGEKTISTLKNVYHTLFNRNNLQMGIVTEEKTFKKYKEDIANMINTLNNNKLEKNEYDFEIKKYDEGIASSGSRVQYVYMGARYDKLGYKYNGKLRVLSRILSRDYIHKKIRVMGGAYGGWNAITSSGKIYFGSYRDPNLKETVEVFKKIPQYLKNLDLSERQMTRYIIGAVSRYESPMSPKSEGMNAIRRKLSGITHGYRERIKKEILDTNLEDIKNFAGMIEDIIKNSNIAAYGNTQVIEKNKDLFDSIIYINK
ncbi:MAG TPA: hypothetical protein VKN74_02420, partial [Candidatus Mcinerneyibacterium sp.]|nr:hypothetical protein [Candidatus Mcinerneyibacterium sp.]